MFVSPLIFLLRTLLRTIVRFLATVQISILDHAYSLPQVPCHYSRFPSSTSTSDIETNDKPSARHWKHSLQAQHSRNQNGTSHPKASDGDTALALFANPGDLHVTPSPKEKRALQWKIDLMILPYLAVCYAFFYINKRR